MIDPALVEQVCNALANLALDGVTAGANPQKDGGMSPPLWHMHCRVCGVRWSKQQWKQPAEHPNESGAFANPCAVLGAAELLAALAQAQAAPLTCDTCQHAGTASEGTRECYHPEWNSLGIECMSVPVPFYCLLHAPRPASAAKEE